MRVARKDVENALYYLNMHTEFRYSVTWSMGKPRMCVYHLDGAGMSDIGPRMKTKDILTAIGMITLVAKKEKNTTVNW